MQRNNNGVFVITHHQIRQTHTKKTKNKKTKSKTNKKIKTKHLFSDIISTLLYVIDFSQSQIVLGLILFQF